MRLYQISVLATFIVAASSYAQSTAFSYQGRVTSGGQPVSGLQDLRFTLFTAQSGGTQVGTVQCVDNVTVVDGVFTTTLDFGQQFATPAARFLQIEVRADTGLTCANTTGFTSLSPRQALTASPLANHAKSAFSLDAADGAPANAVIVDNDGKVGVGTLTPTHSIHVATLGPTLALQDTNAAAQQAGYVSYRDNANVERAWVGYGTPGNPDFSIVNSRPAGDIAITPLAGNLLLVGNGGNVGIGTAAPFMPLHVFREEPVLLLQDSGTNSQQSGYVSFRNGSGTETAWMGYGTAGSPHFTIINTRTSGNIVIDPGPGAAVQVPVLEITGADLAEKFPASEKLEPGIVVAIDREHEGKLCMARGEYNRCVAGVVSGANNFPVGAVLGNIPGQEDAPAIALSGRVYVWCDATGGAIEPGDLLTTSDTSGHAMKASDHDRSHGAVIGKAMGRLENGRGLVLVLVNLQ